MTTSQGAPEAGAIKPLDLTNLLRHAFLSGRGIAKNGQVSEADQFAWMNYDPAESKAFLRLEAHLAGHFSPSPPPGVGAKAAKAGLLEIHSTLLSLNPEKDVGLFLSDLRGWADKVLDAAIAIDLLSRPPVGVEVVKLEWREDGSYVYKCGTFTRYVADSPFGKIVIRRNEHNPNAAPPYNHIPPYDAYFVVFGAEHIKHPTLETAKAAAQADFEQRIRSALVPSSLLKEAEEALRRDTLLEAATIVRERADFGLSDTAKEMGHKPPWHRFAYECAYTLEQVAKLGAVS